MLEDVYSDLTNSLQKSYESYQRTLQKIRTGRANLSVLDGISVDYYGAPSPLNQVAALNVADPRLITIKPWDKTMLSAIEKAIVAANIGITPSNDGETIRLPIPPLTGEVRKGLVRDLKKRAEEARIVARNLRRDANDRAKEVSESEDEEARALKQIQDILDQAVAKIDQDTNEKEAEILEV